MHSSQGTRGTMTGAHLGGRGAYRRRSCSATAAPREGGRRRSRRDGRHHPRPQRSFFSPNYDRRVTLSSLPKLCSWTSPTASKPALQLYREIMLTYLSPFGIFILPTLDFRVFPVDARCRGVNFRRGAPSRGLEWAGSEAASKSNRGGRRTVDFPNPCPKSQVPSD